eukprot:GHRR01009116.1.p1 GENE.GHRR01009116.1~~GHRR01009116.1.p1  ORF type:complete len:560 (+),score=184.24 GHRR01009116.1:304-1983(+)
MHCTSLWLLLLLAVFSSRVAGRHLTQGTAGDRAASTTTASNMAAAASNMSGSVAAHTTGGSSSSAMASGVNNMTFIGYQDSAGLLAPELNPLLVAIQDRHLYNDSKTAVDLVLKESPAEVAAAYRNFTAQASDSGTNSTSSSNVNKEMLQAFVNQTMDPAGSDLIQCQAPDWQPNPPNFLLNLAAAAGNNTTGGDTNASDYRQFGLAVHGLWGLLCRQVSPNVSAAPELHSLLPLPNRTIVPGDRFRETYYWDSYWIIRGLLVSGMQDTAAGLIGNLMAMLERVGHVPNGARVYYLNRSQPPLLSAMVRSVYEASPGAAQLPLLRRALPLLIVEHHYWTNSPKAVKVRDTNGTVHSLSRYWAEWYQPRPESYREDAAQARNITGTSSTNNTRAAQLYHELASGAESGWDYSSRWFADNKTISTIRTTQIIPADLNAWLYQMERNIAWAANLTGNATTYDSFNSAAAARKKAIDALLWDDKAGMWRDGILLPFNSNTSSNTIQNSTNQVYSLTQNPGIFASNFVPLWTGMTQGDAQQGARVVQALQRSSLVGPSGKHTHS